MTAKLLGGSHSSGSVAKTSMPAGSTPVSSCGLPQRGGRGRGVGVVDRAAGEGDLAGVGAHVVGPLGQQQVGPGRALAEEHQHGALAGVGPLGWHEPAEVARR